MILLQLDILQTSSLARMPRYQIMNQSGTILNQAEFPQEVRQ